MAFDAGSIIARLDLDDSDFDRKLRDDVAKIEAFEREHHGVKLTETPSANDLAAARRDFANLDRQLTADATQRMRSGQGSVLGSLMGLTSARVAGAPAASQTAVGRTLRDLGTGAGGVGGGGGGIGTGGILSGIAGGAGPGILGIGAKIAGISGLGAFGLGAIPSLLAPTAALGIGGLGLGVAGGLGAQVIKNISPLLSAQSQAQQALAQATTPAARQAAQQQLAGIQQALAQQPKALQQIFSSLSQLQQWWQNFTSSLAPALVRPIRMISAVLQSLGPSIVRVFAGAMTLVTPFIQGIGDLARMVLPELGQAFRAAAPLMRPLLDGIGLLIANFLPGVITLLRVARPVILLFGQVLGTIGRDLGQVFAAAAPALSASGVLLKALFDIVGGLLPVIVKLADVFAVALAPVVGAFATAIKDLEPALIIVGKVIGSFAGAVLNDLASVLIAVATLLVGITPSLNVLARALSQVFNTLENSGVFGVLASALENLAPSLARLVNSLVEGIAPVLPLVIKLFIQLNAILIAGLSGALIAVADALNAIISAIPPHVLSLLALGLIAWWAAWKGYTIINAAWGAIKTFAEGSVVSAARTAIAWVTAQAPVVASFIAQAAAATAAFIAENAATLGIIALVALLVAAAIFLATHWSRVWGDIRNWTTDAWHFIYDNALSPMIDFFTETVPHAFDVAWNHISGWWDDVKQAFTDGWNFIYNNVISPWETVLTQDIPNAFADAVKWIGQRWDDIKDVIRAPVAWVIDNVLDGLISVFDWITSHVGLGSPIRQVHPGGLATGGRIPGYGGGDRHLALLEGGEAVVSKETTAAHAAELSMWGVPGFQGGGLAGAAHARQLLGKQRASNQTGPLGNALGKIADVGKITAAIFSANTVALVNAIGDLMGHKGTGGATAGLAQILTAIPRMLIHDIASYFIGQGGFASANAIVQKALSYVGKVPYVWGGDTPAGWDCSGMVEYIYHLFGFNPPRTSEEQFGWVKRLPSATPGGLAFFAGADGTQANPGHVGIAINGKKMVNAYGVGFGTIISDILGSSGAISGYGIPPGGSFTPGAGLYGGSVQAYASTVAAVLRMLNQPARDLSVVLAQMQTESAGNMAAVNRWDSNWAAGHPSVGLMQVIAGTYAGYGAPKFGYPSPMAYGVSENPLANIYAGLAYAIARYGSDYSWAAPGMGWTGVLGHGHGYDAGGWLMPGVTVAINNTGMPEAILSPQQSQALMAGHHGGGGRLASVINIMLPEGTTVAQALNELTWHMRVSDQQALAGAGMRPGG